MWLTHTNHLTSQNYKLWQGELEERSTVERIEFVPITHSDLSLRTQKSIYTGSNFGEECCTPENIGPVFQITMPNSIPKTINFNSKTWKSQKFLISTSQGQFEQISIDRHGEITL